MIYVLLGLALAVFGYFTVSGYVRKKRDDAEPAYAIGAEMAAARKADQEHRRSQMGTTSPIAAANYDQWRGELNIVDPIEAPTDDIIRDFLRLFAASSRWSRAKMQDAITMDQFDDLITFSRRMAVFGLRSGDPDLIGLGLNAIAVLDLKRIDFRNALMALSLLHHAAMLQTCFTQRRRLRTGRPQS